MPSKTERREIRTDYLARVEGEGAMLVRFHEDKLAHVELSIYEPPRFFEAFLRGRDFAEAPDITARICGICPVAYQTSSSLAMEQIAGVHVEGQIRALRRLLYCGEWIESHTLHVFMLHAPDFLGYPSAIHLARDEPAIVEKALRLKKLGNEVMRVVGGREVHPVNVRVGGFYKAPRAADLNGLVAELEWARDMAIETVAWTTTLPFPEFEQEYEYVGLDAAGEYPIDRGERIVSSRGLDLPVEAFLEHFEEVHVKHSNALHARRRDTQTPYLVGPLARYALFGDRLSAAAREAADAAGLGPVVRNPFKSITVRAVELVEACEEALRIIREYERPDPAGIAVEARAGIGHGASEAPRGLLYHRYEVDAAGLILDARIVPPTSQNQGQIEADLWRFVERFAALPDDELQLRCEQAIRNYDPCISCATHFLDLRVERT
jgi:coenzyme F420-reducing hydrogenase alpha subunit